MVFTVYRGVIPHHATESGMVPGTHLQCWGGWNGQIEPRGLAGSQDIIDKSEVRERPCLNKQGKTWHWSLVSTYKCEHTHLQIKLFMWSNRMTRKSRYFLLALILTRQPRNNRKYWDGGLPLRLTKPHTGLRALWQGAKAPSPNWRAFGKERSGTSIFTDEKIVGRKG